MPDLRSLIYLGGCRAIARRYYYAATTRVRATRGAEETQIWQKVTRTGSVPINAPDVLRSDTHATAHRTPPTPLGNGRPREASHCMRIGRICCLLVDLVSKKQASVAPGIFRAPTFSAAAAPYQRYFPLRWTHQFGTMATSELPYPTLPENFNDDLKEEDGSSMSKR